MKCICLQQSLSRVLCSCWLLGHAVAMPVVVSIFASPFWVEPIPPVVHIWLLGRVVPLILL